MTEKALRPWRTMWQVPDFEGRSLDMDPDFGLYWHFCSPFIDVGTDKNPNKFGVNNTISDKYAVLWIGFIENLFLLKIYWYGKMHPLFFVITFPKESRS